MSVHWWPNYFNEQTLTCSSLANLVLRCPVDLHGKERKYKYRRMIGSSSSIVQVGYVVLVCGTLIPVIHDNLLDMGG